MFALVALAGCPRTPRPTAAASPTTAPGSTGIAPDAAATSARVEPMLRVTLDEVLATQPRTRAQLHLLHLAQLERALSGRREQFDDRDFDAIGSALFAAMAAPQPDDVRMASKLALAAPSLVSTILDAIASMGGTGGGWDHDSLPAPRRAAVEQIIRSGPASATVWAIRSGFPGERAAASFAREQLGRLAALNMCPVFNELDRPRADALFAGQPAAPCLTATADPEVYARMPNDTLIELVEHGDEAAARTLRERFSAAQSGQPDANTPTVAHFARVIQLAAAGRLRGTDSSSVAVQALTSANNVRPWVDWLVAHPAEVGASSRAFARMLVEGAAAGQPTAAQRAALAQWNAPSTSAMRPIARQWSLPDESAASFEAAWRMAADVREFDRIGGFYLELYRRSASGDGAAQAARLAIAQRNEGAIVAHVERCERAVAAELPRGEDSASWIERAMADAVAKECATVVGYGARLASSRVRAAINESVARGPYAWKLAVVSELRREGRGAYLDPGSERALLAHPRARVRLLVLDPSLWARLPEAQRDEGSVLAAVAQSHALALLGGWPDEIVATPSANPNERAYRVSSSETPGLAPIVIRLGILQHTGPLLPTHVARIEE